MNQKTATQAVHTLLIPTASMSLLTPSAIVAEVVNVPQILPVPFSPPWVIGAIAWRQRAVSVVAFEALLGDKVAAPNSHSKIMIFFPLPGRKETEFFGIMTSSEPQPHTIGNTEGMLHEAPESRFIAAALRLGNTIAGIPDMEVLKKTFYG